MRKSRKRSPVLRYNTPVRTRRIALVVGLSDHFDHGIARGVIRFAKENGRWELFGQGWMFSHFDDLAEWRGDGIIARVARPSDAAALTRLDAPVVDVAGALDGYGFVSVRNADYATGTVAAGHLQPHRKRAAATAFFGVADVAWSARRLEGFRDAWGKRPVACFDRSLDWWEDFASPGRLAQFLRRLATPAVAFCANDSVALRVLQMCRRLGIAVPDELAVLGVDNDDLACELADPSLSSVSLNLEAIGYEAARLLDEMLGASPAALAGAASLAGPRLLPPGPIYERAGTRLSVTEDPLVKTAIETIRRIGPRGGSVAEVAALLPVSRRSLEIRFKAETGRTLHEELTNARLETAAELLRRDKTKISAVAADAGFGSLQRFFELFRSRYHMTPLAYRSRHRDDGSADRRL